MEPGISEALKKRIAANAKPKPSAIIVLPVEAEPSAIVGLPADPVKK